METRTQIFKLKNEKNNGNGKGNKRQRRPYTFKFFKGCLPQILLGPFLSVLSHKKLIILNRHYINFAQIYESNKILKNYYFLHLNFF